MVVDSSALLCVFFNEPEMSVFAGAMERAARRLTESAAFFRATSMKPKAALESALSFL